MKTHNVYCKGDGFKIVIVSLTSLIIGFGAASFLETNEPRPTPIMSDVTNTDTTNFVLHLPIARIGSGIR